MRACAVAGLSALLLLCAGCLQIDTTVRLNADGSATVTERVNFSRRLITASGGGPNGIERFLTKEAALARMKHMGEGVTLVRHEVRDGAKASREAVTVFRSPDFRKYQYVSPFLAAGHAHTLGFGLSPYFSYRYTGEWPGAVIVTAGSGKSTQSGENPKPIELPKGANPRNAQVYRDLAPLFAEMMKDFQLRLRVQAYTGQSLLLIDVSDDDVDQYGYAITENEEVMSELLQWHLGGDGRRPGYGRFLTAALKGMGSNRTLPFFRQRSSARILIRPSQAMFDRYFKGKTLDYGKRGGKQKADFSKIGWKPKKK